MGNKHEIIITQEEISGREIVEVEFMGEKIKEQTFGRQRQGRWVQAKKSGREIWGMKFKGEEILDYKNWGDIEEK